MELQNKIYAVIIDSMSYPLPNVINTIASTVAAVATNTVITPPVVPNESLPMLVIISKDLSDNAMAQFTKYGKVVIWTENMRNVPFSKLDPADYLIIDIRLPDAQHQLSTDDLTAYNIVHYVSWIQKAEDYLAQIKGNVISYIPKNCINKADFDTKILNQPIVPPSVIKSFARMVLPFLCR